MNSTAAAAAGGGTPRRTKLCCWCGGGWYPESKDLAEILLDMLAHLDYLVCYSCSQHLFNSASTVGVSPILPFTDHTCLAEQKERHGGRICIAQALPFFKPHSMDVYTRWLSVFVVFFAISCYIY